MRAVALVAAVAFLLRIAWQVATGFYARPETWEYDALARAILAGRYEHAFLGSPWLTFGTPVYPAVLALQHLLGGGPDSYLVVGVGQALISAALCLPARAIAARLRPADGRAGLLAAALVALSPPLIVYSAKVHELSFEALLAAVLVAAALALAERLSPRRAFATGLVAGLAGLSRPTLLPFGLFVTLLVGARSRRAAAIAALTLAAVLLPWSVRNAVVLGTTTPGSPYTCVTLWMGNHPNAPGGTLALDGRHVLETMPASVRERVIGRSEAEQGQAFCEEAAAWLLADPVRAGAWWTTKLGYFWWFSPTEGAYYPPGWIDLYRFGWAAETALVLLGLGAVVARGSRLALLVVAAELVTVSCGQSFFYVEGRHRLLLEPTLAALAGIGLATLPQLLPLRRAAKEPG